MFEKIIVKPDVMLERFNDSKHFSMAEAVQQFLAPKVGLGQAHTLLVKAIKAAPAGSSFEDVLKNDAALKKLLTDKDVQYVLNPQNYLGLSKQLIETAVSKVQKKFKK